MYHVVIDLEMCRVPRRSSADYRCRMETIQIGAVLLDGDFVRIGTLSEYVNPVSDAPLSCSFGDLLAKMQIKVG
mgnify:CR=1 FL=1